MSKKLHVLFLSHWFPSRNFPKRGNFVLRHAKAIATLNRVTILFAERDETLKSEYEIVEEDENNLRIVYVYFKGSSIKGLNYWKKFRAYQKGLKLIDNFDLIHLNVLHYYGFIAWYYKKVKKINFVITEHWTRWLSNDKSISFKFYCKMMSLLSSNSSYILPVSNDLANKMKEKGLRGNFQVIPNVVDTKMFSLKEKSNNGKTSFLHISALGEEHKNISGILRTTKRLLDVGYDFVLQIGGDGDTSPIRKFIKDHGLEENIFTFGELAEQEVSQKMQQSDYFVLFSNKENQPCVINESFSCGLPVISTKVGGIAELFPADYGILINRGDENGLYEAMKNCIERKTHFTNETNMHQYAENHFSVNTIAEEFNRIYQETV